MYGVVWSSSFLLLKNASITRGTNNARTITGLCSSLGHRVLVRRGRQAFVTGLEAPSLLCRARRSSWLVRVSWRSPWPNRRIRIPVGSLVQATLWRMLPRRNRSCGLHLCRVGRREVRERQDKKQKKNGDKMIKWRNTSPMPSWAFSTVGQVGLLFCVYWTSTSYPILIIHVNTLYNQYGECMVRVCVFHGSPNLDPG